MHEISKITWKKLHLTRNPIFNDSGYESRQYCEGTNGPEEIRLKWIPFNCPVVYFNFLLVSLKDSLLPESDFIQKNPKAFLPVQDSTGLNKDKRVEKRNAEILHQNVRRIQHVEYFDELRNVEDYDDREKNISVQFMKKGFDRRLVIFIPKSWDG